MRKSYSHLRLPPINPLPARILQLALLPGDTLGLVGLPVAVHRVITFVTVAFGEEGLELVEAVGDVLGE